MATITPLKTTPHTRIDNSIIDDCASQIGIYGLGIYVAIKRHLNQKTGECYPSYQTIARKIGIDRGTVIRYVKKLRLLLDSRVVDVTRSYHPICVTISSCKP